MGFFSQLLGLFTRGGRDEGLLSQGLAHAKARRPEQAIEIYTTLLKSDGTGTLVRGRALFNRSLAYSSLDQNDKALADLKELMAMPNLPDNIQVAARERLARLKNRKE